MFIRILLALNVKSVSGKLLTIIKMKNIMKIVQLIPPRNGLKSVLGKVRPLKSYAFLETSVKKH